MERKTIVRKNIFKTLEGRCIRIRLAVDNLLANCKYIIINLVIRIDNSSESERTR